MYTAGQEFDSPLGLIGLATAAAAPDSQFDSDEISTVGRLILEELGQ